MKRRIVKNTVDNSVFPTANVTKKKQRLKQFENNTIYLNNGDEFEIELFNPTTLKVLARIELNGKTIGDGGIVLRPGERVFLERFLEDNKKFLFETYNVNGANKQVLDAIQNNGDVVVKFYSENLLDFPKFNSTNIFSWPQIKTTLDNYRYGQTLNTSDVFYSNTSSGNNMLYDGTITTSYSSDATLSISNSLNSKSLETGRIEKGNVSSQSFDIDNTRFNSYHFAESKWKILPLSQKPKTIDDIVVYCVECGSKRKKDTHKFCPHCGTKY